MNKELYKYAKKQIKQAFPKYKRIQVGATIKEVEVKSKESLKTIPLMKFNKVYNRCGYMIRDIHQLYVAVDQSKNTVYWNYELVSKLGTIHEL